MRSYSNSKEEEITSGLFFFFFPGKDKCQERLHGGGTNDLDPEEKRNDGHGRIGALPSKGKSGRSTVF